MTARVFQLAFILTLYAALKAAALPRLCGRLGRFAGSRTASKIKVRTNVKGNGQECPFHTGNVNVKGNAAGVRDSHLSQKTRKMGHPRLTRVRSGCGAGARDFMAN